MRTNWVLLASAASVMVFALTGCGSDDGGSKLPTAGGGGSAASAGKTGGQGGGNDVAAYVESQRKWVACMRTNGVDLPDPDSKGQVDMSGQGLALKKDPKFMNASKKCAKFNATVPQDLEPSGPKLTPAQMKKQRDYAACMQKNGAPDFPDPDPNGSRNDNSGEPGWDQTSAGARRATRVCAPIIGEPTNPPAGKG
ncbi:hypothetical protein [Streptomyces colonosanans]|uniref:PASTA domain-containing protein n=1 Tax=Streptomyces colonosanans TaxID=1428652 RepID=A0A1S2PZR4_9ACTN|nr:hypothetical protein [Streptomyces colonosanans]OIJ98930.1 hypothetical protein BIV24_05435 [Streptomyces colonosanans]